MGLINDIVSGTRNRQSRKVREEIKKNKSSTSGVSSMINPEPVFQYSQMAQTAMTKTKPVTDA